MKRLRHALTLILVCPGIVATANADSRDDFSGCAAIVDDTQRLACFDRVMKGPAAGEASAEPEERSSPAPVNGGKPEAAPGEATHSPSSSPSDAPAQPAARRVTVEPVHADDRGQPGTADEQTAIVTAVSERAHGRHVVTLDNGQVWEEEFASRYFPVEPGDTVTIEKRWLSGYRLVAPSGRGFGVERIR